MKKTALNALLGIISTIVASVFILIFTRSMIRYFFDEANGLVRTANAIISYAGIAQAGIGTALIFMLYPAISNNDEKKIAQIMKLSKKYFRLIGIIYITFLLVFSSLFPFVFSKKDNSFSFNYLFLICFISGLNFFFVYFFFAKYSLYLKASNKDFFNKISTTITTFIVYVLVLILMVKYHSPNFLLIYIGIISLKNILDGMFAWFIASRERWVKMSVEIDDADAKKLKKLMFNALIHQVATLIVFSTDEIVLGIYSHSAGTSKSLVLISVYTSYLMVMGFAKTVLTLMISSVEAHMGLNNNSKTMEKFLKLEKYSIYFITLISIIFVITIPYWVDGIFNINSISEYFSPELSILMTCILFLSTIRIPSSILISINGHFKETRWRAIFEAVINIVLSLILVWFLNIYGVLLATVISFLYRTIDMIFYSNKFIDKKSTKERVFGFVLPLLFVICSIVFSYFIKWDIRNILETVMMSLYIAVFAAALLLLCYFIQEKMAKIIFVKKGGC